MHKFHKQKIGFRILMSLHLMEGMSDLIRALFGVFFLGRGGLGGLLNLHSQSLSTKVMLNVISIFLFYPFNIVNSISTLIIFPSNSCN